MNIFQKFSATTKSKLLSFRCVLLIIFALNCITFHANGIEAQIASPRLSYLDTNNGLNQDTINDIYVDKAGFVWIATLEGLSRFDGVKVLTVTGLNFELTSNPVVKIHEHSSGLLLLSTESNGVLS